MWLLSEKSMAITMVSVQLWLEHLHHFLKAYVHSHPARKQRDRFWFATQQGSMAVVC